MYVIGSVSKKIIFYDSIFCMNTQGKEHRMYYSYIKTYRDHPWLSGILFPKVARFMKNMPNISPQNDMDHLMLSAPLGNLFSQLVDR